MFIRGVRRTDIFFLCLENADEEKSLGKKKIRKAGRRGDFPFRRFTMLFRIFFEYIF